MKVYRFLTVLYVLAIYGTLPWMRKILRSLNDGLGRWGLGALINVLLVLLAAGTLGLLRRSAGPRGLGQAVGLYLVVVLFLAGLILLFAPEERVHLFEYGLLGFLCMKAMGGTGRPAVLGALLLVLLVSIGDETLQYFLPSRVGDLRDVFLNGVCGSAGILVEQSLRRGRAR